MQAIFLQQSANPAIDLFTTDLPPDGLQLSCDAQQIGQALTNLLKNAAEAIDARIAATGDRRAARRRSRSGACAKATTTVVLSIETMAAACPSRVASG